MRKKLFLIVSFFIVLLVSVMFPGSVNVQADTYNGGIVGGTGSSWENRTYPWENNKKTHVNLKPNRSNLAEEGDRFYYRLEAGMPESEKASWVNPLGKTADVASVAFGESVMFLNKIMFGIMKDMANFTIGTHEIAKNNFGFIDKGIDEISSHVKKIVGISDNRNGLSFTKSGMFNKLISLIVIAVIVYAFYQLVWKRSFISSFSEILKFILVLTLSLLLFSNYGVFLKTVNKTSGEINDIVVGSVSTITESGSSFERTLWEKMIDKPYLILQYGTDDLDKLTINDENGYMSGKQRVRSLLIAPLSSESRHNLVSKEINEYNNYHMTFDSVVDKSINNFMFLTLNLVLMIPVLLINFAILFTQIWFIIIALLAPFALLIASFPTQFNVLGRYSFELLLPLIVKIMLGYILTMVIFLTDLLAEMEMQRFSNLLSGQIGESYVTVMLYTILLLGVFFLRKRIMNIINSGSEKMAEVREGLGSVTTKPLGNTVRGGANLGGAVIGGAVGASVGNPLMGATTGMRVGTIAGDAVTGKSESFSNVAKDSAGLAYQATMHKHIAGGKGKPKGDEQINNQQGITPSSKEEEVNESTQMTSGTLDGQDSTSSQNQEQVDGSEQPTDETLQGQNNIRPPLDQPHVDDSKEMISGTLQKQDVMEQEQVDDSEQATDETLQGQDNIRPPLDQPHVDDSKEMVSGTLKQQDITNQEQADNSKLVRGEALKHQRVDSPSFDSKQVDSSSQMIGGALEQQDIQDNELLSNFYRQNDVSAAKQEQFNQALTDNQVDMNKISPNTLARHNFKTGDVGSVAGDIKAHQLKEQELTTQLKGRREEKFDNYLEGQNLNKAEVADIKSHLKSNNIDVASIPRKEYEAVNTKLRDKMKDNDTPLDFKEEFQNELVENHNGKRIIEQPDRVLGAKEQSTKVPKGNLDIEGDSD